MQQRYIRQNFFLLKLFIIFFLFVPLLANADSEIKKISKPGKYQGYSKENYDSWIRKSQYITVQEGTEHETRLAADLFFPVKDGQVFYEYQGEKCSPVKLPVIWTYEVYSRAIYLPDGSMYTWLDEQPWLKELLKHGYVVAVVDERGTSASFGKWEGPFNRLDTKDTYDVTEWLAEQEWSSGNIGMFGYSTMGFMQYIAASGAPSSLKCIVPSKAPFDMYSFLYPGGVNESLFTEMWGTLAILLNLGIPPAYPCVPVDDDPEGILLKEAQSEHLDNYNVTNMILNSPYRDSFDPISEEQFHLRRTSVQYIKNINKSGIPVYVFGGWDDAFSKASLLWYNNLKVPKKVTIGPWEHQGFDYNFHAIEHLRWFDYWLKGIDNGIMSEKPIYYYTNGSPEGKEWKSSKKWPIKNIYKQALFFHEGRTGTVNSINDGFLHIFPAGNGADNYTVDFTTTTGFPTRWTNCWEPPPASFGYPEMTYNDEKGLTYTSFPLPFDVNITGHPEVHLWVSSDAEDGDFYVYLEEIDKDNNSKYITEGVMRASHRKLAKPPYNNMKLQWHRSFEEDIMPLTENPSKLIFDLLPTSYIYKKGTRIRITITCADMGNRGTEEEYPQSTIKIYRDKKHPSYIILPIKSKRRINLFK